jgi:hypothetical protein
LGVCCPPEHQLLSFKKEIVKDLALDDATAEKVGAWIYTHFDLAPAGTLKDFKGQIADMARKHPRGK